MGFCYQGKRLVCDNCGAAEGTTRKRRCPSNYCYPSALCKKCWTDKEIRAKFNKYHIDNDCAGKMQASQDKRDKEAAMIAAGAFIRCSALGQDDGRVHVIFRGNDKEVGKYMAKETYAALPFDYPATPEDYEKIEGKTLENAPTNFY